MACHGAALHVTGQVAGYLRGRPVPRAAQPTPALWPFRARRALPGGVASASALPAGAEEGRAGGGGVVSSRQAQRLEIRERHFAALEAFKEEHGHCNVPWQYEENTALARWVRAQRDLNKEGRLEEADRVRLLALGFLFDPHAHEWESRFGELLEFREAHGDCNVPREWPENQTLANWVGTQRTALKRGHLDGERRERLEGAGFEFVRIEQVKWEQRYQELADYKERYGDCRVPWNWQEPPGLGSWVATARAHARAGALDPERKARLDALGFAWRVQRRTAPWEARYQELLAFRQKHGHCDVPEGEGKLERWAAMQRKYLREGRTRNLSEDRRSRLDAVGFTWDYAGSRLNWD